MSGGQSHKDIRDAQDESSILDNNIRGHMILEVFKYILRTKLSPAGLVSI